MFRRALALFSAVLLSITLAPAAAMAASSEGSGGAQTNRLNQTFTANGISSQYHIFADGLDWSKPVGLLLYTDGSGGYGLDNPNSTYLLDADGSAGLVEVARKHNLLLVTPFAPSPSCDGADNCWYNTSGSPAAPAKADWARALVDNVYSQYSIDKSRVAIGGYSSGAQFTTGWFVPRHGAAVQDAVARGVRRPLIVLPTGTGKTVVFASLIARRGGTVTVVPATTTWWPLAGGLKVSITVVHCLA